MDLQTLKTELMQLSIACQSDKATDDERARLERLLHDNPQARTLYLKIADDTVTLHELASPQVQSKSESLSQTNSLHHLWAISSRVGFAVLATAALFLLAIWGISTPSSSSRVAPPAPTASFARIVNLAHVDWVEGSSAFSEWDTLNSGDTLRFESGVVEVLYNNGVQFFAQGPANLTFTNEGRVTAALGKIVARVSPDAIGFEVTTPKVNVVDRGTSFGVTVDQDNRTDVVVYEGLVDLELDAYSQAKGPRMEAGEALRVSGNGKLERIASIASDMFLPPPALGESSRKQDCLILGVTDNLKASQTSKGYRVIPKGFREDCTAYVDRPHQWNGLDASGIPSFLNGQDYVMTFNDDKVSTDLRLSVNLCRPARLYVLIDNRVVPTPEWLVNGFVDTGWDIGVDEGYPGFETSKQIEVGPGVGIESTCSVWSRDIYHSGPVLLGCAKDPGSAPPPFEGRSQAIGMLMYGIVASELPDSIAAGSHAPSDR